MPYVSPSPVLNRRVERLRELAEAEPRLEGVLLVRVVDPRGVGRALRHRRVSLRTGRGRGHLRRAGVRRAAGAAEAGPHQYVRDPRRGLRGPDARGVPRRSGRAGHRRDPVVGGDGASPRPRLRHPARPRRAADRGRAPARRVPPAGAGVHGPGAVRRTGQLDADAGACAGTGRECPRVQPAARRSRTDPVEAVPAAAGVHDALADAEPGTGAGPPGGRPRAPSGDHGRRAARRGPVGGDGELAVEPGAGRRGGGALGHRAAASTARRDRGVAGQGVARSTATSVRTRHS